MPEPEAPEVHTVNGGDAGARGEEEEEDESSTRQPAANGDAAGECHALLSLEAALAGALCPNTYNAMRAQDPQARRQNPRPPRLSSCTRYHGGAGATW